MSIAIKFLVLTILFGALALIFPSNILTQIGVPTAGVSTYVQGVAALISNLCTLGDVFLNTGTTLLMVKAITLFIFTYSSFRILFPIVKLIAS